VVQRTSGKRKQATQAEAGAGLSLACDTGRCLDDPSSSGFSENLEYFKRSTGKNQEFWDCFGGIPDLEGKTVAEIGCGHGGLCIYAAQSAASCQVVGVDTDCERIDFAKWNVHTNYPELEERVDFRCADIRQLQICDVDAVYSRATFEHILELDEVLAAIKARLKPGGRLYTAFAPLYYSVYGGHGRIHNALPFPWLPWGHLLVTDRHIVRRVNRSRRQPVSSVAELGLNKLSVGDYRRVFEQSGMTVVSFRTNLPARGKRSKALSVLSRLPCLEKYATHSIVAVLERPA
jgi:SAM-dependent methyltransferase